MPNDEARLIARCKAGDTAGYAELVRLHQNDVVNLLCHLLGNYEDACDSAQETFAKAFRSIRGFRGECRFSTWLYCIAMNTGRSMLRQRAVGGVEQGETADPVSRGPDPWQVASLAEQVAVAEKALKRLHVEHRQVIVLHEINGCCYEEIAQILDCAPGTVKSRLHRARAALRETAERMLQEHAAQATGDRNIEGNLR